MKIIYIKKCLDYCQPGHPESPDRIRNTAAYLEKKGYSFIEPEPCDERDLLRVHTSEHVKNIQQGSFYDADTPVLPQIDDYARLAAGSAIMAAESALEGTPAYSLMRPPGHHATRTRAMGFCYYNNIAIAIKKVLENHSNKRAVILDIDCHHGNGTEDIFIGSDSVLYISLHQSPLYPGTGCTSNRNCINFPLSPGTDETRFLDSLKKSQKYIFDFKPSLLGISAGFDTLRNDPLTQINLEIDSYLKIGDFIKELKIPFFIVMEGGYSSEMPQCVFQFLEGLKP